MTKTKKTKRGTLAAWFNSHAAARGLRLEDVAARADLSYNTVRLIRNGSRRACTRQTAAKLATLFGVPIDAVPMEDAER